MSRIHLDTSAYSAFKRGHSRLRHLIREARQIEIDAIVLGELHAGFLKGSRTAENLAELAEFLASPRVAVVAVDEDTARRYAHILQSLQAAGTPIPTNDIWIAASAMQCGSTLVTADAHFRRVPQIVADIVDL